MGRSAGAKQRGSASARPAAAPAVRPPSPHGRSWRFWAAAVAAGALIVTGLPLARRAVYSARLPALPDLSHQPAAIRLHLTEADRVARAHPTSAEAVGAAGLAYHSDMFYDQAERCYAIAAKLSSPGWRWTYYRALAQGAGGDAEGLGAGLRQVVAAAPGFSPAWWQLGEVEFKAGHYDRAGEAWGRVLPLQEPAQPDRGPVRIRPCSTWCHRA